MSVFLEVLQELGSMFFGTPRMAVPLLILIVLVALVAHFWNSQIAGVFLLFGCLGVLAENVLHTARKAKH